MTPRIQNILALITKTQTADEAVQAVQNSHPQLSKKAAQNVIQDMQDFADKDVEMSMSELDYRLAEVGL